MKHDEPLLIHLLRLLMAKGEPIWMESRYSLPSPFIINGIERVSTQIPKSFDQEAYNGLAFSLTSNGVTKTTLTPDEADNKFELVKRGPNPDSKIGHDRQNWQLERINHKKRVQESQQSVKCCDNPPLIFDLIENELRKGTKIKVDFHEQSHFGPFAMNGYDHSGIIEQINCKDSMTIIYQDDGSSELLSLFTPIAEEHAHLVKIDGQLTLVDSGHQHALKEEVDADAPIWVSLIKMYARKGTPVFMWDSDNHDEDGIVIQIHDASWDPVNEIGYVMGVYANRESSGALAGTESGTNVIDIPYDMRLEKRADGIWFLGPNE